MTDNLHKREKNKNRRNGRFLTGLPRGYFFWGKGAAIHNKATIKPCRRPLRETESHVRLKQIHSEHCTLLKDLCNLKNEYQF